MSQILLEYSNAELIDSLTSMNLFHSLKVKVDKIFFNTIDTIFTL